MQGTINRLNLDRKFGFIKPNDGGADCFFHASDLLPALKFDEQLTERQVEFETIGTEKGPRAMNVRPVHG